MKLRLVIHSCWRIVLLLVFTILPYQGLAADKLVGFHSARTMSQSMPWIAEEAGLFKKYNLDLRVTSFRVAGVNRRA